MKTLSRLFVVIFVAFVSFGIAACGNTPSSGQPAQNATTPTSRATPVPTAQSGQTPAPQAQIVLSLNKTQYRTNERIQVTITNHLTVPIFLSSYYTNCTAVKLERLVQNNWLSQGRCPEATTHSTALQPGASLVQQLTPVASTPQMATHAAWSAGTYRAAVFYTLFPDGDTTQGKAILSSSFLIN